MSQKCISKCGICYLQFMKGPIKYFVFFLWMGGVKYTNVSLTVEEMSSNVLEY